MEKPLSPAAHTLSHVLAELALDHHGFCGNCARVAHVLDQVLDAQGQYVIVAGEHYEYADHVFLRWEGVLWDMDGPHTIEEAQECWCQDEEEDDEATLEDFVDPDGSMILRMADENGPLAGGFDPDVFRRQLTQRLTQVHFHEIYPAARLTHENLPTPSDPQSARPTNKPSRPSRR